MYGGCLEYKIALKTEKGGRVVKTRIDQLGNLGHRLGR